LPVIIVSFAVVLFFLFARQLVLKCKALELEKKNSIFHFFGETANGLAQIKVYGQEKIRMQRFSSIINESTKTAVAF
jgi:ABC-type bacteriocin/lantibiotic exporter with double-glycine peptidase domain